MNSIPNELHEQSQLKSITDNEVPRKALGVCWNIYNGCLYVSLGSTDTNPVFTRIQSLPRGVSAGLLPQHLHEDPLPEPLGLGETESLFFFYLLVSYRYYSFVASVLLCVICYYNFK